MGTLAINVKGKDSTVYVQDYEKYEVVDGWLVIYGANGKEIGRYNMAEVSGYHDAS